MCGIFGILSETGMNAQDVKVLASHSKQRGIDASGIVTFQDASYQIVRANFEVTKLLKEHKWQSSPIVMGQSRMVPTEMADNQPVVRDDMFVIHNGIVVNEKEIWDSIEVNRLFEIDSEAVLGLAIAYINEKKEIDGLAEYILSRCKGTVSAALALPKQGKMLLLSNNGSLYTGMKNGAFYFASESYPLTQVNCTDIKQIRQQCVTIDIPVCEDIKVRDIGEKRKKSSVSGFQKIAAEEAMLQYPKPELKRCTKCLLPETMPYISFDSEGVCNYCRNYTLRNVPKPKEELFELVKPYRRAEGPECIVPFSGGRDSCYGLHIIVKELEMTPITYTYDWGMVTDLGRRNISRMCSELGVENITVAADIKKKRENITKNLKAWLKSPHLGMISILTAGDKHFFKYVESMKKQTGIDLNLWGINPLEVTHFKAGFLGIKPDFEEKRVYMPGIYNQLRYQFLRFKAMTKSPGYFNSSIWDTLSGEYYRSFVKKTDYFHLYDYWRWDEELVDNTLAQYDWELAPDTNTTWRIGDGTAAFYNYVYYTVAGFTEHDTFRSNQIREGQLSREEALKLVEDENRPRYQNIRWYLDLLGMDFSEVIGVVNAIPKLYPWNE